MTSGDPVPAHRSGYTHAPALPTNAIEAGSTFDVELYNLRRLYMANRGVWEAIYSAGPACGIQTSAADVDHYLDASTPSCETGSNDRPTACL